MERNVQDAFPVSLCFHSISPTRPHCSPLKHRRLLPISSSPPSPSHLLFTTRLRRCGSPPFTISSITPCFAATHRRLHYFSSSPTCRPLQSLLSSPPLTRYLRDGLATTKSDVYAFGVVLFELISRTEAVMKNSERRSLASIMLGALKHSPDSMSMSGLKDHIDPNLLDLFPHDCVLATSTSIWSGFFFLS